MSWLHVSAREVLAPPTYVASCHTKVAHGREQLPGRRHQCPMMRNFLWSDPMICNFPSDRVSELSGPLIIPELFRASEATGENPLAASFGSIVTSVTFSWLSQWLFCACCLRTGRGGATETRWNVRRWGSQAPAVRVLHVVQQLLRREISIVFPLKWGFRRRRSISFICFVGIDKTQILVIAYFWWLTVTAGTRL